MTVNHAPITTGKNTGRINQATKDARKPGVSPKFIQHIRRDADLYASQGSKNQAR